MMVDFDITDPLLAQIAWNRLAEPGDELAFRLIAAHGPSRTLGMLIDAQSGVPRGAVSPAVRRAIQRWLPRLATLDPRRELQVIRRLGGRVLTPTDPDWPTGLADLDARAPLCLWALGPAAEPGFLRDVAGRAIAIVGARNASDYGLSTAADWAGDLAGQGYPIVSGGAFGIDAAAHRGALGADGGTIAIMAGGIDRPYPKGNLDLLRAVRDAGGLVAEVPPGSAPMRMRFLQRNRLIAALSRVTVVVEAGWRSGSQHTARQAHELMRPVGAVPGPVTSASSAGCHRLLREGVATCVTDVAEVVELAAPIGQAPPGGHEQLGFELDSGSGSGAGRAQLPSGLSELQQRLWGAMPAVRAVDADALARSAGLSPAETFGALGVLESRGIVMENGGLWRRVG